LDKKQWTSTNANKPAKDVKQKKSDTQIKKFKLARCVTVKGVQQGLHILELTSFWCQLAVAGNTMKKLIFTNLCGKK